MKKSIYPHELVGKDVLVISSKNKSNFGIEGKIVDETKSTIKIEQNNKIKVLLKSNITIKIKQTGQVLIGKDLVKRPEDRLKGK
jgi:ribonuclease P protein subunit POP4